MLRVAGLCAVALVLVATGVGVAAAPPIAGKTIDGRELALRDLRGKPVVINVWSSW